MHDDLPDKLGDWETAKKYLGHGEYYPDLFRFFRNETERLGWKETMGKYLFEGSERSDDLLRRMFSGVYSPLSLAFFLHSVTSLPTCTPPFLATDISETTWMRQTTNT